jgi:hypothetical protein
LRYLIRITTATLLALVSILLCAQPGFAQQTQPAPQRLSDHDIEALMKNLKQDAGKFQSSFNSSISKSAVRKTDQEKIYKDLVKSFVAQCDTMLSVFQSKHTADTTLPGVLITGHQVDNIFIDYQLTGNARPEWNTCKAILIKLAAQFDIPISQ